jgi:hypothetical protein
MKTQVGDRYQCMDSSCGCEIEITAPCGMENESSFSDSANDRSMSSAADEPSVGSLRNAEAQSISTPGDYGSQGATDEGVFGTSGGNQRSTTSGRFGSSPSLRSSSRNTSNIETASADEASFSCCCGQPMRRSTTRSHAANA